MHSIPYQSQKPDQIIIIHITAKEKEENGGKNNGKKKKWKLKGGTWRENVGGNNLILGKVYQSCRSGSGLFLKIGSESTSPGSAGEYRCRD